MHKVPDWDNYFLIVAKAISVRSKDPHTQVGAVVVDNNNRIIGTGYNGLKPGILETKELWERPTKYEHVIHAEENCLNHLTQSAKSCKIYITMAPCGSCAEKIVKHQLSKVVYLDNKYLTEETIELFKQNNIELERLTDG